MNIPASLVNDLKGTKGFDIAKFTLAHELPAVISVRRHPLKGADLFADHVPVPWCDGGAYLPIRPVFTLDPSFHAGAYYVQEASSMFLEQVWKQTVTAQSGLRVLDLCAAPGGKSTLLASLIDSESLLVSNEVIRQRASILEENMCRWGYMNTWVTGNDPRDFGKLMGCFDVIVVDAPCSGSGLWRKDAAALNEWSEANVNLCSGRQQRILADVWPALKEGGILIYATCSYSPQEDEDILDWLATEFDVTGMPVATELSWGIEETISDQKQMHGYRFFPGNVQGEGFFIAAVRKNEEAGSMKPVRFKTASNQKTTDAASHLLATPEAILIPGKESNLSAIYPWHEADLHMLQQAVYVRRTGPDAGMPIAKEWLPAHDIALSVNKNPNLPTVAVNREQALKFLKREDMDIPTLTKGWYIVTYNGQGLGWIKALGNRVNNYLPKHWRIRMETT